MNKNLEEFVQKNRAEFDAFTPDPAVLQRIQQQFNQPKKKEVIVIPIKNLRWVAAASIIVLIGSGLLFWPEKNNQTVVVKNNPVQPTKPAPTKIETNLPTTITPEIIEYPNKSLNRFAALQASLAKEKQNIFYQLSNTQSASMRLSGATAAYEMKNADKDIIDVLIKTMNTDPNSNVRLAALDALSKFYREKYVKKQLVSALSKQKDPIVQIALIQLLTQMKENTIVSELQRIAQDGNSMDAVKDQAYDGIRKLSL